MRVDAEKQWNILGRPIIVVNAKQFLQEKIFYHLQKLIDLENKCDS